MDKTIKIWNIETGQCMNTLEGHTNYVNSVLKLFSVWNILDCSYILKKYIFNAIYYFSNNFQMNFLFEITSSLDHNS